MIGEKGTRQTPRMTDPYTSQHRKPTGASPQDLGSDYVRHPTFSTPMDAMRTVEYLGADRADGGFHADVGCDRIRSHVAR